MQLTEKTLKEKEKLLLENIANKKPIAWLISWVNSHFWPTLLIVWRNTDTDDKKIVSLSNRNKYWQWKMEDSSSYRQIAYELFQ